MSARIKRGSDGLAEHDRGHGTGPIPKPEHRWRCGDCEIALEEEPPSQRECSAESCGETFIPDVEAGDDPVACPSCNRPFTRVLAENVCRECEQEMEESVGYACESPDCSEGGWHEIEEEEAEPEDREWSPKERRAATARAHAVAWHAAQAHRVAGGPPLIEEEEEYGPTG